MCTANEQNNQLKFGEKVAHYHNVNFEAKLLFKKNNNDSGLSKHDRAEGSCFELKKLIKMINMLNFVKFY